MVVLTVPGTIKKRGRKVESRAVPWSSHRAAGLQLAIAAEGTRGLGEDLSSSGLIYGHTGQGTKLCITSLRCQQRWLYTSFTMLLFRALEAALITAVR